jgi:hypothetical protein
LDLGIACRSKTCCSIPVGSRRAKSPKDEHKRAQAIAGEENHISGRKQTKSIKISQRRTTTRPPKKARCITETEARREDFIPFSGSQLPCIHVHDTNPKLTGKTSKRGILPLTRIGIHCCSMALRAKEAR